MPTVPPCRHYCPLILSASNGQIDLYFCCIVFRSLVPHMILMVFSAAMRTTGFALPSYLARVGLSKVFSVPFENPDIHLGRGVSLEPEQLVLKIIHRKQGGYCFEPNGILQMALESLALLPLSRLEATKIRNQSCRNGN